MTNSETRISVNPETELATDKVGLPYRFITADGDVLHGVTEVDARGQLIARFPDGRWTRALVVYSTEKS